MNTYAFLIKAKAKSDAKNLFCWFSAKSDSRAEREMLNILDDADIDVGRGADYQLPVRTDWLVVDDLPAEKALDETWCDRYELAEDQRTWKLKDIVTTAVEPMVDDAAINVNGESFAEIESAMLRPVARLRLPQRLVTHLLNEKHETHISEAQHVAAVALTLNEDDQYVQDLLRAINSVPSIAELSAFNEWKLMEAFKKVFPRTEAYESDAFTGFMHEWTGAEQSDRAQVVKDCCAGKQAASAISGTSADAGPEHTVATLSFRHRLLAQFITDENFAYQINNDQLKTVRALEMDTDNSYAQNLLLAAENIEGLKDVKEYDLWKLTDAVKRVFPTDDAKAPDLALLLQFMKAWSATRYPDRGLLVKEWMAGKRVSTIQRTDSGTNAGGGIKTDRSSDYTHTLDTLDVEIACATLPMDFDIYNIPASIHRRAKDIVAARESPFKEWSALLRKAPGILDFSRAAIFAVVRQARAGIHNFPSEHQAFVSSALAEYVHDKPDAETLAAACKEQLETSLISHEYVNEQLAVARGDYVPGISDPTDPKWDHTPGAGTSTQPAVENLGGGVFSIDGLLNASSEVAKPENETAEITGDVQMEENHGHETEGDLAISEGEAATLSDAGGTASGAAAATLTNREIIAAASPKLVAAFAEQSEIDAQEATPEYPAYFEPGRYEGLPNNVYHAANGISSTQVKDARVSLMYFNARHVAKTIARESSKVLDMGNLVHALALQPETLDAEFSIEPVIPEGALTTTATIRALIDEYNASLPPQLSTDDIKRFLEEYNATLPAQVPLGDDVTQTGENYMALPAEFQRVEEGQKVTAVKMKACIKEYNATLPAQIKTSGSRDTLLEQLAIINPDLVAQEAQKPAPLKVSGTKADLIQAVKAVKPDAVFADELLDAWRDNPEGKVLVTRQQLATAQAIQSALLSHPTAGMLLTHPSRAVEVSYFGFDEETGLEVRVRPDLEIDLDGVRIGADLKTISMWNVKQESLRTRLHREIIDRDYHLSAAMYCETAALDQFFWIFVNKDENYHWIAIIEASAELLELGMLEYRKAMRAIATGFDTGEWPAPITADYTDELNDFDQRRLEALRTQA